MDMVLDLPAVRYSLFSTAACFLVLFENKKVRGGVSSAWMLSDQLPFWMHRSIDISLPGGDKRMEVFQFLIGSLTSTEALSIRNEYTSSILFIATYPG